MTLTTLFYIALILLSGLFMGRAVKHIKLPNVTGYLLAGLLFGPYCLKLIPLNFVKELTIMSDLALAFIAFSIGSQFKLSYLKKVGKMPIIIAVLEGLGATVVVTAILVIFGFDFEISLLLGAIASATAPAATMMVVKQYNAQGPVTSTLLSVVALDDAVAIIAFGLSLAIVNTIQNPGQSSIILSVLTPFIEIIGSIVLGIILGILFNIPLRYFKKDSNRLIITTGFICLGASLATMLGLSPLLLCMCMGAALINTSDSALSIFKLVDSFTPPIFVIFFVTSGADLDITLLSKAGILGILYIIFRVAGKIGGASLGAILSKAPGTVKKYIGFTLIPQAGVAIGLSQVAAQTLPEYGPIIRVVILSATLIYELTGPAITKLGLVKAGEIST